MIRLVDELLWKWAQSVHTNINGLGYSSSTIEYKLAKGEPIVHMPPTSVVPSFRIDHETMEVGRAVETMRERWRDTIKARYLCGMGEREGAEYLDVSVGTFRRDLDLAHAWIAGRLGIP